MRSSMTELTILPNYERFLVKVLAVLLVVLLIGLIVTVFIVYKGNHKLRQEIDFARRARENEAINRR